MRGSLILAVCLSAVLLGLMAGAGLAQERYIEITPWMGADEGDIPVQSGQPIDIWAHVGWDGHDGERFHIEMASVHIEHLGGGDTELDWRWIVEPTEYHVYSEWFPWGILTLYGEPSNRVAITADIAGTDQYGEWGPILSNTLVFHVIPEPAAAPLVGLALTGGAILWRRFRAR